VSPAGGGDGTLLLSGMRAKLTATGGYAPEDHQIVLTGPAGGGSWSWQPAPFAVSYAAPTSNCYPNYSPDLLPSTDGRSVRLTAPSRSGPNGCEERTGSAPAGVLPYPSPFTGGTDAGWKDYGGCWSLSGGAYLEDCGGTGGSKALAGSTGWTDYTVATDVELTSADANANAGLLARVTDPDTGTDAQDGYYIGLSTTDIVVGRQAHGWTPLSLTAVPGGVAVGDWWHLSATLTGCTIAVTAYPVADPSATTTVTDTDCTFAAGLVGVRDFATTAAFRSFGVRAGGQ
jgi:hypothetical protein